MTDFLTCRGSTWHFVRRVPSEFAALDPRGVIRHSTRIKIAEDRHGRRALRVAHTLNQQLEGFWKELATGQSKADLTRYDQTRRHARSLGYDYIPNSDLLALPQEKRLERLEASSPRGWRMTARHAKHCWERCSLPASASLAYLKSMSPSPRMR